MKTFKRQNNSHYLNHMDCMFATPYENDGWNRSIFLWSQEQICRVNLRFVNLNQMFRLLWLWLEFTILFCVHITGSYTTSVCLIKLIKNYFIFDCKQKLRYIILHIYLRDVWKASFRFNYISNGPWFRRSVTRVQLYLYIIIYIICWPCIHVRMSHVLCQVINY